MMKLFDIRMTTMNDSVQGRIFPQTSGYDIHFVWSKGEEDKGEILRQRCRSFLNQNLGETGFVVYDRSFDKAVGPWQSPMWFIEICTVDRLNDLANPSASDPEKFQFLFELIRQTQPYLVKQMEDLGMKGTLFIHANTLPHNSNMTYERQLHLDHSWTTGDAIALNDIWGEENGLIDQEAWIKERLMQGQDDQTIMDEFINYFEDIKSSDVLASNAKMLIEGQRLLETMTEEKPDSRLSGL